MRRLSLAAFFLAVTLCGATPADAVWHLQGWGRGGCGYGGYGWRGCGYPAYGYRGFGWCGSPRYGRGYYATCYPTYCAPWYDCSPYGYGGYGSTFPVVVGRGWPVFGQLGVATPPRVHFDEAPKRLVLQAVLGLKDNPLTLTRDERLRPVDRRLTAVDADLATVLSRVASIESRRKAERLLREGDELFRSQNFHFALQKYKLAASTAADLAEAFWRKGHALIATHNYELAATAFKRASALSEDVGRDGFELSELYGGAAMTKTQHLESLAEWALAHPDSSDPYFLLGVFLHYDGQPARAEKFFAKAADLAGMSGGHMAVFQSPATAASQAARDRTIAPRPAIPAVPISEGTEI
jgi:hypothetical protein